MKYVRRLTYVVAGVILIVVLADIAFGMHCGVVLRLAGAAVVVYGVSRFISPLTESVAYGLLFVTFGVSVLLLDTLMIWWLAALGGQALLIAASIMLAELVVWAVLIAVGGYAFGRVVRLRKGPVSYRVVMGATLLAGSSILVHLAPYWRSYDSPLFVVFGVLGLALYAVGAVYGRHMIHY